MDTLTFGPWLSIVQFVVMLAAGAYVASVGRERQSAKDVVDQKIAAVTAILAAQFALHDAQLRRVILEEARKAKHEAVNQVSGQVGNDLLDLRDQRERAEAAAAGRLMDQFALRDQRLDTIAALINHARDKASEEASRVTTKIEEIRERLARIETAAAKP